MKKLIELRGQRVGKVAEMRTLHAKDVLEGNEETRFKALEKEVEMIDGQISREERMADLERQEERAESLNGGGHRETHELESRFRIGKAFAEHIDGKLTGVEAEWAAENRSGRKDALSVPVSILLGGEQRALTTTTPAGGPGSNLVQTSLGPLIDRLRPVLAVEGLGATILRGLTGNLDLPRVKASGTAGWVAEHGAAGRSDGQFDKVSLAPKTVAAEYEISRRMMLQATALETILRNDLGYLLAQALDGAAIKGGGANEPVGIIGTAAVPVVALGANGAAITIDTAADLIGSVFDANSVGSGFLTNSKVQKAAMKLKDSQLRPFGVQAVFQNQPVAFSNQVPSNITKGSGTNLSAILYGNWADLVVAYWSAVDIVINPYHSDVASKGGALIHAFLDADVALRHPESFAVVKDAVAA
jgi:HK97 family phage major capsid protein